MIFKTEGLNFQEAFDDTAKLFFRSAGPVSLPREPSGRAVPRLLPGCSQLTLLTMFITVATL